MYFCEFFFAWETHIFPVLLRIKCSVYQIFLFFSVYSIVLLWEYTERKLQSVGFILTLLYSLMTISLTLCHQTLLGYLYLLVYDLEIEYRRCFFPAAAAKVISQFRLSVCHNHSIRIFDWPFCGSQIVAKLWVKGLWNAWCGRCMNAWAFSLKFKRYSK